MKLLDAIQFSKKILVEYNTSGNMTNISAPGGNKAFGKNYDRMAVGLSNPYATEQKYITKYAKVYPALAGIVDRLKNSALPGDILVTGKALNELNVLLSTFNPKTSEAGEIQLPFGDNIRLKIKNNKIFIGFSQEYLEKQK